jgi:hypothetical protein
VSILGIQGRTLEVLKALAAMKSRTADVGYLLGEIGTQMPAALELFNTNLAAGKVETAEEYIAALAALLPGNAAILNAALACNATLGREDHVQKYLSAAHALNAASGAAQAAQHLSAASP